MEIVYEGKDDTGDRICFTNQISDYEIQTMIGKGACSAVFKAKCKICGCLVAIKESSKKQLKKKKNTNRLKNEITVRAFHTVSLTDPLAVPTLRPMRYSG